MKVWRVKCSECGWLGDYQCLLTVPIIPPDSHESVSARFCPECKEIVGGTTMLQICDEPGCTREVSCGWPTKDGGYRNTCGDHYREREAK